MQKKCTIAIIGGSGFYELPILSNVTEKTVNTPFGDVFGIVAGEYHQCRVVFLPRHGHAHRLAPHKINYRANLWALRELRVDKIIALNAVGGIDDQCSPGVMVLPDQIIDYTYGREHTYADLLSEEFNHVDFAHPFDGSLRKTIEKVLTGSGIRWINGGTYGCTQGPRLETAAEVQRLKRDGCTLVGMTMMPEAGLARELDIAYASLCTVVNWGAGVGVEAITLKEISSVLERANGKLLQILQTAITEICES